MKPDKKYEDEYNEYSELNEGKRYKIIYIPEDDYTWYGCWALIDSENTDRGYIFTDEMEPEDAILVRDLKPLVDELNRLAKELEKDNNG